MVSWIPDYMFGDCNTGARVSHGHEPAPVLIFLQLKGKSNENQTGFPLENTTFPSASNFLAVAVWANRLIGSVVTPW